MIEKNKPVLETPTFQHLHERLIAHQSNPENIRKWEAELARHRAAYWKSPQFLLVLAVTLPLIVLLVYEANGVVQLVPLTYIALSIISISGFLVTWPRRHW